ncbi:MAG: type VI secretion system protein IglI family protein [Francisellaceae bacterium]
MNIKIVLKALDHERLVVEDTLEAFESIYHLVEEEAYQDVIAQCMEKFEQGIVDRRYVCYVVFALWYEAKEMSSLVEILAALSEIHSFFYRQIQNDHLSSKRYLAAVAWLHEKLYQHVEFLERLEPGGRPAGDKALFLSELSKYGRCFIELFELDEIVSLSRLSRLWQDIKIRPLKPKLQSEETVDITVDIKEPKTHASTSQMHAFFDESRHETEAMHSEKWRLLCRQIDIYQKLVTKKQWLKAAVAKRAIIEAMRTFNPIDYFPAVFYPFFATNIKSFQHVAEQERWMDHPVSEDLMVMFNADVEQFYLSENPPMLEDLASLSREYGEHGFSLLSQDFAGGENVSDQEDEAESENTINW